ncbi:invasin domain 3-containing protein, partial [Enterobacter cancerogenus]|uniref:invasin domain 3-containing protein n=1 Tax=Enterobacter cancerogenus TaxID=69218 RepID=UPI0030767EBC
SGDQAALTADAVAVPHAALKSGSSWADNQDGTYTATYTAGTAGTGLKATLKLAGWKDRDESGSYAITAATPDREKSAIAVDSTTYASGDDMKVTVTLKDASGNAVSGDQAALTADAVAVPHAALKSGSSWADNQDGTYTATYTAGTAGTGLKATLKLAGWKDRDESGSYAITAATPDREKSAIAVDSTTYASGDDMKVTVTLKDASGNAVSGDQAALTADAVAVPHAALKSGSSWADNQDGTYTATYTAGTAGTGLKATLKLAGWKDRDESGSYAITLKIKDFRSGSDDYIFNPDVGFPSTGFKGAKFTIEMNNGSAADYTWKSNVKWVNISTDGVVSFTENGKAGEKVIITGLNASGENVVTYEFTLKTWFVPNTANHLLTFDEASNDCMGQGGGIPSIFQLTGGSSTVAGVRGTLGGLWSEWGSLKYYSNDFGAHFYWMNETNSQGVRYLFKPASGNHFTNDTESNFGEICAI